MPDERQSRHHRAAGSGRRSISTAIDDLLRDLRKARNTAVVIEAGEVAARLDHRAPGAALRLGDLAIGRA